MRRNALKVASLACLVALIPCSASAANKTTDPLPLSVQRELIRLRADLDAQGEARTRQADAFDAATTRIEIVNGALVLAIALAGIVTGFFGYRWVRSYAEQHVTKQVEAGISDIGREVFETEAKTLRDEYDEKFAEIYRRYSDLVERD